MKIFNLVEPWRFKTNFVDENNVVLGWDMEHQCSESFGWSLFEDEDCKRVVIMNAFDIGMVIDLPGFAFDPSYVRYEQNAAIFKIVGKNFEQDYEMSLYIRLENRHNGYYSHGFKFTQNETVIVKGFL